MKGLIKAMVIGVLAIAFLSIFLQKIPSQGSFLYCVVHFCMENKDRYCYGNVHAEFGWEPEGYHYPPFGNWGVNSNILPRENDDQFQGWHWYGFPYYHWDWNSCTVDHHQWKPPSECGVNYNYNVINGLCWQQKTSTGINN